ncbi:hypothetical protein PAMP_001111 [Pampus punctatissimus]
MDLRKVVSGFVPCCLLLALSVSPEDSEDGYLNILQSAAPLSCLEGFSELGYYNGSVSHTDSGSPCLKWTDFPDYMRQYPGRGLGDHSFCRNPDREANPWCFFRQSSGAIGWAYCDCHQGAARLVGGTTGNSGRLEVYLNGQWGAVCDTHWTDRDASVICRQLGLGEIGTALQHSYFGPGSVFHYERLGCRGNENSLLECRSRKFVTSDCNHGNEAGLVCAEPEGTRIPVRLVGGLENFEGRVEVYHDGMWGTICDDQWDDINAEVVCRQLGLGGVAKAWTWAHFGQGSGPIFLDGVRCTGNELSLEECPHNDWKQHNCDHVEDAGVSCNPYTGRWPGVWTDGHCREGDQEDDQMCRATLKVIDVGGTSLEADQMSGTTLEVDIGNGDRSGGQIQGFGHSGDIGSWNTDNTGSWITGSAENSGGGATWDTGSKTVGDAADSGGKDTGDVAKGNSQTGTQGLHDFGRDRTRWDRSPELGTAVAQEHKQKIAMAQQEAAVAQEQETAVAQHEQQKAVVQWEQESAVSQWEQGLTVDQQIQEMAVVQLEQDTTVAQLEYEMASAQQIQEMTAAQLEQEDGAVRLVGADRPWEGRVEIYHQGEWGTVCDDNWTELNAQVVCRQLGFRGQAKVAPDGVYEEGQGLILLDEVQCLGSEASLLACTHSKWGQHDCSHSEDVGVSCEREDDTNETPGLLPSIGPLVRLVAGESRKEGRVEVYIHGQWGSVCDDGWNDVNAAVVCRQLGFIGVAKARSMAYFGEGRGPIHLDNVRCSGNETSLGQCAAEGKDSHDCRHSEDAGVICDYTLDPMGDGTLAMQTCGLRLNNQRRRRRIIGGDKSLRFGRDPSRYVLRLGDYHTEEQDDFERTLSPERIVIHRKYHNQGWEYDIALLRLKGTEGNCVAFNPHTGAVCLPEPGNKWEKRPAACVITGWGITDSEYSRTLLQAWVPLLPAWKCKKRYGNRFTSRMLCAGSLSERHRVDSCQGDSGGPLVCQGEGGRWVLTGVISWGHGCGNPFFPGVYTRVSRFLRWIDKVINKPYKN